jgi:hypothetical protein
MLRERLAVTEGNAPSQIPDSNNPEFLPPEQNKGDFTLQYLPSTEA